MNPLKPTRSRQPSTGLIPLNTYLRRASGGTLALAASMGLMLTFSLIGMWQSDRWAPWHLIVLITTGFAATTLASGLWRAAKNRQAGARKQATIMTVVGCVLYLGGSALADRGMTIMPMLIAAVTLLWIFPTQDIEAEPQQGS